MKRARFIVPARHGFLSEVSYYNGKGPALEVVSQQLLRKLQPALSHSNLRARRLRKNTRRVFVKNFPFPVVYRPSANGIVIFAVAHHSHRPSIGSRESKTANKLFKLTLYARGSTMVFSPLWLPNTRPCPCVNPRRQVESTGFRLAGQLRTPLANMST